LGKRLAFDDGSHPPRVIFDESAPNAGIPRGELSHPSLSLDGKQVAFFHEVVEPRPPGPVGCSYEHWSRVDLYVSPVAAPSPRKVMTLAHVHHCAVD
jgi:hypothetical protein